MKSKVTHIPKAIHTKLLREPFKEGLKSSLYLMSCLRPEIGFLSYIKSMRKNYRNVVVIFNI